MKNMGFNTHSFFLKKDLITYSLFQGVILNIIILFKILGIEDFLKDYRDYC